MAEFTKGPWSIVPFDGPADAVRIFSGSSIVGVVGNTDASLEENDANARLIAAAPTLLECLEDEVREMRARGHEPSERTLAVIAAVKGGSRE